MNYEKITNNQKNIFLVDMKNETNKFYSEIVLSGIKKYLGLNKKIAILINKKGYSSGIMCQECGFIPKCKFCDISIAYHLQEDKQLFGICHMCKRTYNLLSNCPKCGSYDIKQYGLGTQKIKEFIDKEFKTNCLLIESETVNSPNKIIKLMSEIEKSNILIGTSLLNCPPRINNYDLVIFLNADIGLNIPDFNANLYNFLFLYETIIKYNCNNFIIQTYNPENYCIKNAFRIDFESFRIQELEFRRNFNYPPFVNIGVIMYKNDIEQSLFNKVNSLYQELLFLKQIEKQNDLEIFSTPPLIYKMYGKYRYNIILKSKSLKYFMDKAFTRLKIYEKGFKIDRQPNNLI